MALKIDFSYEESVESNNKLIDVIEKVCGECALGYNDNLYAGVYLTDDEGIRKINDEFRKIDKPTDVLSFPLLEAVDGELDYTQLDRDMETGGIMLGDIIISTERIKAQAAEYGHSVEREAAFLACHGMLHLMGYDHDESDREKLMIGKQKEILDNLGFVK